MFGNKIFAGGQRITFYRDRHVLFHFIEILTLCNHSRIRGLHPELVLANEVS